MLYLLISALSISAWSFGGRSAVLNDSLAVEKFDDNGFTNDLELLLFLRQLNNQEFNVFVRHRMITERGSGKARWDEMNFNLQYLHYFVNENGFKLSFGPYGELALGGNLDGAKFQNFVHHAIGARTIESGELQYIYSKKNTYGVIAGASLFMSKYIIWGLSVRANLQAQAAVGSTGFNKFQVSSGIIWKLDTTFTFAPQISFDIHGAIYNTPDSNLTIPGGYVINRFLPLPKIEVAIVGNNWSVGYGERWNEGGSGHSIGFLYVEIRQ